MIIGIDIDGTLCKEICWTQEECLNATPRLGVIKKVGYLYIYNFIIIYTARRDHLIAATMKWLRLNDVPYHAISNKKIGLDMLIDDKCISVETFLKGDICQITEKK